MPWRGGPATALFFAFAGFYLLGTGGHLNTPDAVVMFHVTESLVSGHVAIRELESWPGFGGVRVADAQGEAHYYAQFGLGASVAAIPGYLLGSVLAPLARESERNLFELEAPPPYRGTPYRRLLWYDVRAANFAEAFRAFTVSWTSAFAVAGTLAGLFLVCELLGFPLPVCRSVAVLAGIASPLWHYSREFFAEPLAALGLVYFLYFAVRGRERAAPRALWSLAGAMLGLTVVVKIPHLVLIAPAAVLLAGYAVHLPRREALARLGGFVSAWLAAVAVVAAYNWVRFGSPLVTGYGGEESHWTTPMLEGLMGLLVSPGRGLVIYFPLCVLTAVATRRFAAAFRAEALFIGLTLCTLLLIYARWFMWEGGWCWGPRFLVPVLPLLVIPVASLLGTPGTRWQRRFVAAVVALSVAVSLSGVLVNQADYHSWLREDAVAHQDELLARGVTDYYELARWDLSYAPVLRYWDFPGHSDFLVLRALRQPGLVLGLYAVFLAGCLLGVWQLLRAPHGEGHARKT